MNEITLIRPATPADSDQVVKLIYLSMGIEADWLFGQEKGLSTESVMAGLFRKKGNRMSYPLSCLAEQNGEVAGLLLAYPGKKLSRFNWMTGWQLLGVFGLRAVIRLANKQSEYGDLVETESDEFYISNLGVFPKYQGKGIGTRLMLYAEELARKAGINKCSLIVTFGHKNARRLYEHLGFQIIRSYFCDHPMIAEGSGGYHRMVKALIPLQAPA